MIRRLSSSLGVNPAESKLPHFELVDKDFDYAYLPNSERNLL
jgi:hypothetical protein